MCDSGGSKCDGAGRAGEGILFQAEAGFGAEPETESATPGYGCDRPVWSSYQCTIAPSSIQRIIPLSFLRTRPMPPSFVSFPLIPLSHFLFCVSPLGLSPLIPPLAEALTRPLM